MRPILLLGNTGQLGYELERALAPLGQVAAYDYPQVNLAEPSGILAIMRQLKPAIVVNATAYTAVDRAEGEESLALAINALGPAALAEESARLGAVFIHYSTDYVFDGAKGSPYVETDAPNPLGAYGRSKLAGEQAVQQIGGAYLVFRTAWVYSLRRDSFVTKVLAWARQQTELRLVTDQVSNPTWSRLLAEVTAQVLAAAGKDKPGWVSERAGLYHLAGDGWASRMEWGQEVLRLDPLSQEQMVQSIFPSLTADFPTPARRPLFSALDCMHFMNTFGLCLPPWQYALSLAMLK